MIRQPTHPGEILKEDVLPALKLNASKTAEILQISRQYMGDILNERKPLNTLLCLKIGKMVGNEPEMWMNMQSKYNLWQAQQNDKTKDVLSQIPTLQEFDQHPPQTR